MDLFQKVIKIFFKFYPYLKAMAYLYFTDVPFGVPQGLHRGPAFNSAFLPTLVKLFTCDKFVYHARQFLF